MSEIPMPVPIEKEAKPAEQTPKVPEEKKLSRREFLRAAGAVAVGFGTRAVAESPFGQAVGKLAKGGMEGALELKTSFSLSNKEHSANKIEIVGSEPLLREDHFFAERLSIRVEGNGQNFKPALFVFNKETQYAIKELPDNRRESLLNEIGPLLSGPVGYVKGDYRRADGEGKKVEFASAVTDRFPGFSESLNEASGGIRIRNGQMEIVGKSGLLTAQAEKDPFVSLLFYLDEKSKDQFLSAKWQHFGKEFSIGDTAYNWGAYIEYQRGGEKVTGFIVNDKEMTPISDFVKVVEALSDDGNFKMALADAGNGSSMIGKGSDGHKFAFGVGGDNTHFVPATVEIR
jgi:hypothetical protein